MLANREFRSRGVSRCRLDLLGQIRMSHVEVLADDVQRLICEVFQYYGLCPERSQMAADVLLYAETRGIDSHGLWNLCRIYVPQIESGQIDVLAESRCLSMGGATAVIDGGNGLGLLVGQEAMAQAIGIARELGASIMVVRRSSHFGCAGYYASMAIKEQMIGVAMTNLGRRAFVRPINGSATMVGTNPISLAAPAGFLPPFVLDMSTSAVPVGKIETASRTENSIPQGWLVDDDGRTVTDPRKFERGIAHLQFLGGELASGGHKGYGLALAVDILAGVLAGAQTGPGARFLRSDANSLPESPFDVGHFFMAIDIARFRVPDDFQRDMERTLGALLQCPPRDPSSPVVYPGYREWHRSTPRKLSIHRVLFDELRELAVRLGITRLDSASGQVVHSRSSAEAGSKVEG